MDLEQMYPLLKWKLKLLKNWLSTSLNWFILCVYIYKLNKLDFIDQFIDISQI